MDSGKLTTTADGIAAVLRDEIQRGLLAPGQPLRQEEVAARLGVSRIPVREALGRLEAEGLVIVRPNRGAVVVSLSTEELREVYDLRALVEGDLLARSVPGLSAAQLARAEALHAVLGVTQDPDEQGELNREFHQALLAGASLPRQHALVVQLRGVVERYEALQRALLRETVAFQVDHQRILDACRRGDAAGARLALEEHLHHAAALAIRTAAGDSPPD